MNLVDSSGWLEYFADSDNADNFAPAIENTDELLISTINIYEVFKKVLRQKDIDSALQAIALMQQALVVDVNSQIALTAAELSERYKIPMADSIIYTTSNLHDAILWTQDSDFINLPNVKYFPK
jgi:predicted nucleic acid-binding protein